jgi:hypothetical protein
LGVLVERRDIENRDVPMVIKPDPMLVDEFVVSIRVFAFETIWNEMSNSVPNDCHVVHDEVTNVIEFVRDSYDDSVGLDCLSLFVMVDVDIFIGMSNGVKVVLTE